MPAALASMGKNAPFDLYREHRRLEVCLEEHLRPLAGDDAVIGSGERAS